MNGGVGCEGCEDVTCECKFVEENHFDRFVIAGSKHRFLHTGSDGVERVLINEFWCAATIDFASVREIKNCHGVKQGYMFIVGERSDD